MQRIFEWDPAKAASNKTKHGVSFEIAILVFADPFLIIEIDMDIHNEDRWRAIGLIDKNLMLLIVHTSQDEADGEIIRIISARRATSRERMKYERENDALRH